MADFADALKRAETHSPFLAQLMQQRGEMVAALRAGKIDTALAQVRGWRDRDGELGTAVALRRERGDLALAVAIADLAGAWDLAKVTSTLSDFADDALDRAIVAAFAERYDCDPRGFCVIALGKHGGRELNYSSDIDPIFLFDPDMIPVRAKEEPQQAAIRIGRRVIELLSERTGEGYVFRVDMRLRPSPEATPLALPVDAAISYYESAALAWEQAAFIRSRVAAGDRGVGEYFLTAIQPFIWRKSIDFGQVDNIARMSRAIRDHYSEGQKLGLGYDLKRGRGGIRECEFFAQVHQLVHGGRNADLRVADTRIALSRLADAGLIAQEEASFLQNAYTDLRTAEHRLQMMHDRQTHELPDDEVKLTEVARLHGFDSGKDLIGWLEPKVVGVADIYDDLTDNDDEDGREEMADGGIPLTEQLSAMGFDDATRVAALIERWRSGKLRAVRSDAARDAFEKVLPAILRALADSPDPERALVRFDTLIEQLPTAINFFHLLDARPGLLEVTGNILAHAPVLADALARRVELLDGLIDARAFDLPGSVEELAEDLSADEDDFEALLDRVRERVGEHRFALGVQLVEGAHDPLDVAEGFARVAEAALHVLVPATIREYEKTHGVIAGGEMLLLALGRLGGGALTYASDLDVIFLFEPGTAEESDGRRPLGRTQYFNRLAQRIIAAMTVPTASGPLYEVDTRLRPSGNQGLLSVSLDAFERYQREQAWTWEHMALCRARPVYGSPPAREKLSAIVQDALLQPRDEALLAREVAVMRRDVERHKPAGGAIDAKLLPGGLMDIEFLTHFLQLSTGVGLVSGVEKAISELVDAGQLDPAFADAHLFMTRLLVLVRLVAPGGDAPPVPTRSLVASRMKLGSWDELMASLDRNRELVISEWTRHLGARDFSDLPAKDES